MYTIDKQEIEAGSIIRRFYYEKCTNFDGNE